jgi:hypothetical protein
MDLDDFWRYIELMKNGQFEEIRKEKCYQKELDFKNVEITPDEDFPIDLRVEKEPIEIRDGDKIGANSVEVRFEGETMELMQAAEKFKELPEEERLSALIELVRARLQYPYTEVMESASEGNPDLKKWFEERFGERPKLAGVELNESLKRGYGDCKIIATAYLLAAQSAELKGIYANSGTTLKNLKRPDNGQPIFRSVEVDRDLNSTHAWVEIQLSDGSWVPVDPTAKMVGQGEMLKVFEEAGYRVPISYMQEGLLNELVLDRGDSFLVPAKREKTCIFG